uniref:4-coumarate--CoA ligase 1-like n=1 Tax=Saccoglossus kowalevskii TaxID=10224 RepID=A0ABM0MAQ7_SACKO|nr:PREDICTED: 4-coumarate--CoA ligase 1-like [Saccoglossus kowalevskii]
MTIPQYVMKDFGKYGNRTAMVDSGTGRTYTFTQLQELVHQCATGLTIDGFQQGDVCAIQLPNSPEFFITLQAVLSIGGIVSTVNPLYTEDELLNQLKDSSAKSIVTSQASAEGARSAAIKTKIKHVYIIGGADGCKPFSSLLDNDGSSFPKSIDINPKADVALLSYSSGTTGLPKGVMVSHFAFIANLIQMSTPGLVYHTEEDSVLAVLPFFHIYGNLITLNLTLSQGAKCVAMSTFDAEQSLKCIQEHKITSWPIVPPIALFLAKHPVVDCYDVSSLNNILIGAAPLSEDLADAVIKRINRKLIVRQGYGLTENIVTHICYGNDPTKWTLGSSGILIPNTEAKITNTENGSTLGPGETGEICLRGPQQMLGYLGNEKATRDTIDKDKWVHTGDIGYIDEQEQLHVVDRMKELIKYKAYQVAPAELEALLISHPGIKDAGVIGVPHEEAGEVPKAFVVRSNTNILEKEVFDFIEGKCAPYKKLRGGIQFVDEIPKSQSGKILRRILKEAKL